MWVREPDAAFSVDTLTRGGSRFLVLDHAHLCLVKTLGGLCVTGAPSPYCL